MKIKDPGSALTHFIGMLMSIFAATPLLIKAAKEPDRMHLISLSIFILSMILLYAASTIYHTLDISQKVNTFLRKVDHMMIFVLIAGSYTPICLVALKGVVGWVLFGIIWGIAIIGITLKMFWIKAPNWVSSSIYIIMGWTCVIAFSPIINALPREAFNLLLAGGIIYTIGGIIYAIKKPILKFKNFGSHEVFHLFVMGGSICHFIMMYKFIASMPF